MKCTVVLAGLGIAALPSAALAQSVADPGPSGDFYAGVHAAYATRNADWLDLGAGPLGDHDASGLQAGVQLGYDVGLGPVFVGVNGSFTPTGHSGKHIDRIFGRLTPNIEREHSREKWSGMATLRAGTQLGGYRLYAKGGLALSHKRYAITGYYAPDAAFARSASTRTGWVVGAGLERKLLSRLSAFAEYTHADYGRKLEKIGCTASVPNCGSFDPTMVPVAIKETSNRFAMGVNFHF